MSILCRERLIRPFGRGAGLLRCWWRRARTRRQLRALDARLLDDLGLTEDDRRCEGAKRFWEK